MYRTLYPFLLLTLVLIGCGADPVKEAETVITEDFILAHTRYLAHDLLEGRGPGTRGDDLARHYIASQFEAMGIEPGGPDGSYFQPVPLVGMTVDRTVNLTVTGNNQRRVFLYHDDFMPFSGVLEETVPVSGDLVFVGYGIRAPEYGWDDYKGMDMTGKVLVMLNDDPGTEDTPDLFGGRARTYYGRWTYKYEIAAELGAAGAIVVHTTPSAGYPYSVVQTSWGGENFELRVDDDVPLLPLKAWTSEQASREIFRMARHDMDELFERANSSDFVPVPLNLRASTTIRQTLREVDTYNVLGLLRGGDPNFSDQVVVYTAHYDHFGIGEPDETGDTIYNGALDNAAGVSQMLSVAYGFTKLPVPPHRSVLFAAVGAEEFGLLGSEYYVRNSTIPHNKIVACINMDGANIWGPTHDIIFIGAERSTIGDVVEAVARQRRLEVEEDQYPEQGSFYRSDHFSFAKAGIPAVSLRAGSEYIGKPENWGRERVQAYNEKHYHQPSDEVRDDWNLRGAVDQARFCFDLGWRLSLQREMPVWHEGDEFKAVRQASLKR
jgi:Zn-dependent M28 family amino/carboxypeptidase